jgi:hypothetical protein
MNNASKGRCVTVTPRGKSEDETLKAKPGIRKGQYWCGRRDRKGISQKITKDTKTDLTAVTEATAALETLERFWPPTLRAPGSP